MSCSALLSAEHLTISYGERPAVLRVSLRLSPGDFLLLTGPSGCGKTTLALALCGIIPHALPARVAGRVCLDGRDVASMTLPQMAGQVGVVFQNPATQLFHQTVEEEVAFGPHNLGFGAEEIARRVDQVLIAVGIGALRMREVRTLSGGEQQRAAIAAALATGARTLILDEPTASLDPGGVALVAEALARLKREGVAILVIEHRLEAFAPLATRALLMDGGRIIAEGLPAAVFSDRDLLRRLGVRPPGTCDCAAQIPSRAEGASHSELPLVRMAGVRAGYGSEDVLRGIDLEVYAGEFLALVGDNGSGKTTLALTLAGLLKPKRGRVEWCTEARRLPPGRRVGMLFQDPLAQLLCDTVEQEVDYGPHNYRLGADAAEQALAAADLLGLRNRPPTALSSGQQQRVALAAAAATLPRLLILDEPTLGQDWGHLERLMELAQTLQRQGHAILLITHDMRLVRRVAERVVVLRDGVAVCEAPGSEHSGGRETRS